MRGGIASAAISGRSASASSARTAGSGKVERTAETAGVAATVKDIRNAPRKGSGEKRFRALQTDKSILPARRNGHAPRHRRAARQGRTDDYLHIFFHPDYDRRLWHRTRSAA